VRVSAALVGAVLLGSSLVACGGSGGDVQSSAYCKEAKKASPTFKAFSVDGSNSELSFKEFHQLAGEAPGAVKKDWTKLDNVITSFEKALSDAGLSMSDLVAAQQGGDLPKGTDESKLAALGPVLNHFKDAAFTDAAKRIDAHAKKACKVTLHVAS
jgi:hypothetical protein